MDMVEKVYHSRFINDFSPSGYNWYILSNTGSLGRIRGLSGKSMVLRKYGLNGTRLKVNQHFTSCSHIPRNREDPQNIYPLVNVYVAMENQHF